MVSWSLFYSFLYSLILNSSVYLDFIIAHKLKQTDYIAFFAITFPTSELCLFYTWKYFSKSSRYINLIKLTHLIFSYESCSYVPITTLYIYIYKVKQLHEYFVLFFIFAKGYCFVLILCIAKAKSL